MAHSPPVQPVVYVVVCRDLHGAIGLFPDLRSAIEYSKLATQQAIDDGASCLYAPLLLKFLEGQVVEDTMLPDDRGMPGQYL